MLRLPFVFLLALFWPVFLLAQVFQRGADLAGSLALGGASTAFPDLQIGLGNEALLGRGESRGLFAGAALPYSIGGWQTGQLQFVQQLDKTSGLGVELARSAIEIYGEQRVRLAYGRRFGAKILAGASFDWLQVRADDYGSASSLGFGFGFLAEPLQNFYVGGRFSNPFSLKINDIEMPSRFRLGFCWRLSPLVLLLSETEKDSARPALLKLGFQYKAHARLFVRGGFRSTPGRMSFGAGLILKKGFGLDFASEWHPVLGLTPAAGLVWRS